MTICYHTTGFRLIMTCLFCTAAVGICALLLLDITMDTCNDPYHDVEDCLNSTNCDMRYCEPSLCGNYTCLPRMKSWCIHNDIIFYPNGDCPQSKGYKTSIVVLSLVGFCILLIVIYLITICHYRYIQYHQYTYLDNDLADKLSKNPDAIIKTCTLCYGVGKDMATMALCDNCRGSGKILVSDNTLGIRE